MSYFKKTFFLIFIYLSLFSCSSNKIIVKDKSFGGTIIKNTVWSGEILLNDNVVVSKNACLTILPGTTIKVAKNEHAKVEPQFYTGNYGLIIRGTLKAEGKKNKPIKFLSLSDEAWSGIFFENNSQNNRIKYCNFSGAETAINIINSSVKISDSIFEKNTYAVVILSSPKNVKLIKNIIRYNKYGIFSLYSSHPNIEENTIIHNQEEGIYYSLDSIPDLSKNIIKSNKYNIRFVK